MDGEARGNPGLDPAVDRAARERGRRGRRSNDAVGNGADRGGATYAALDLGTNNCRLLVARPSADGFRVVDAFSRIIRLGEGLSASGQLSDAAIARAIDALSICRDKMKNKGATRARLIATEACRSAGNGEAFRSRVARDVGLDLEIIDRETEACLAATGCTPLMDPQADSVLLFDIGGGSSELVRLDRPHGGDRGPPPPRIRGWISLAHGVVTLAERHGGEHVTREVYEAMVAEVASLIEPFSAKYGSDIENLHLLGTSGTVTTIAGVHLDLRRYDRSRVDGCWMSADEIDCVVERLLAMDYRQRKESPCIGPERADLVMAGCAILEAIRRAFPVDRLRVADRGLREGMLVQMMRDDGVWNGEHGAVP
jgi:exopolyphosphatase/guanosine-5'-triphosphate,3'-diphosphate pyrophosphatase